MCGMSSKPLLDDKTIDSASSVSTMAFSAQEAATHEVASKSNISDMIRTIFFGDIKKKEEKTVLRSRNSSLKILRSLESLDGLCLHIR